MGKQNIHGKIVRPVLTLLWAVSLILISGAKTSQLNDNAARNKAVRIIEQAEDLIHDNILFSTELYRVADGLAPEDTAVMLAVNNVRLILDPQDNPLYFRQLDLLESTPNAPLAYYYNLVRIKPPLTETSDSLAFYTTALKAVNRFPGKEILINELFDRGAAYLFERRFSFDDRGEIVDTLELDARQTEFAEELLARADSIERQVGYMYKIDSTRAALYRILDRKDDLVRLSEELEKRDSTDIETLDLLTTIAYVNGDSLKLSELGLRRFRLEPDGSHVYSLYEALPNDSMRGILVDDVIATALNTDLDIADRMRLLQGLARSFYLTIEDTIPDRATILDRISEASREITAEDPGEIKNYFWATFISSYDQWIANYGYLNWIDAVEAIPDSAAEVLGLATVIVPKLNKGDETEKALRKLYDYHREHRPDQALTAKLTLAQYYFNTDDYERSLELLKTVTLQEIKDSYRLEAEYNERHPDEEADEMTPEEINQEARSRWIAVETMVSECQMQLDRYDDAMATLSRVIAIDPENDTALNNLAYYMCEHGGDLDIALSLVDRALALSPDNLNAIDTRAWILYRLGQYGDALKDMTRFFEILNADMNADILDTANGESIIDVFDVKINVLAVAPIVGHLLSILSKGNLASEDALWRVADFLIEVLPDDAELKEFLSTHERSAEEAPVDDVTDTETDTEAVTEAAPAL